MKASCTKFYGKVFSLLLLISRNSRGKDVRHEISLPFSQTDNFQMNFEFWFFFLVCNVCGKKKKEEFQRSSKASSLRNIFRFTASCVIFIIIFCGLRVLYQRYYVQIIFLVGSFFSSSSSENHTLWNVFLFTCIQFVNPFITQTLTLCKYYVEMA